MYTQLKERIKQHEGFRRTVYSDSLGFATIGYGHLVLPTDNFVEGVEYTKEELDKVFDVDFEKAVNGAKELIGNDSLLPQAEEVAGVTSTARAFLKYPSIVTLCVSLQNLLNKY